MSAPMWTSVVDDYINGTVTGTASSTTVAKDLQSKTCILLDLIECIGKYLMNEDHSLRGKAVRLISEVLHQLPRDFLTNTEVELLVTYLCERLVDHHSIQPNTLYGLLALTSSQNLPDECAKTICNAIFRNVQNQTLAQADRRTVYTIFSNLLDSKLTVLQQMGSDFVYGYIQAMDTEKDPRNLLTAFYCAQKIILNFTLGVFVEEMFEVTSCYFPIDFTPPPNDPHGITREDLILGLRGCLSATEKFGPLCLPLLLEKLTSDVQSAKLDSLQTLVACCEVYGSECLREYQGSLFRCIKQEVFASGSPELEEAAVNALTGISSAMSPKAGVTTTESDVDEFVKEVLQDCRRHLKDEDLRLFVPTCRLLEAICLGSDHAASIVLAELYPLQIEVYNKQTVTTQRKKVLENLLKFVAVLKKFKSGKAHKILLQYKDMVLSLLLLAASDVDISVQCVALSGLGNLSSLQEILTSDERSNVANLLLDKAFSSTDTDVRDSCLCPLKVLTEADLPTTQNVVLPSLISRLNTESMDVDGTGSSHSHVFTLLAAISINIEILREVVKAILTYFTKLAKEPYEQCQIEKLREAAKCLVTMATCSVSSQDAMEFLFSSAIPELYKLFVLSSVNVKQNDNNLHDFEVVQSVSTLIRVVATHIDTKSLSDMCLKLTKLFLLGDTSDITKDTPPEPLSCFDSSSPWQQTQLISVVMPVICSCPKQEDLPEQEKYINRLTELSTLSQHPFTRTVATKFLSHLVNKHKADDFLTAFLSERLKQCTEQSASPTFKHILYQFMWLTKALVMRGHSQSNNFLKIVIDLLGDSDLGEQAASGFEIILSDQEEVLNKAMHSNIRMMYKQRLFIENSAALVDGFQKSKQDCKKNYLLSLSHMLKHLPRQVLLRELPPLFPMLIQSLMCNDISLQISTMSTLADLISDAPELITQQIDSVIPQLLKFCTYQHSMKVRINALKCLRKLVTLPETVIMPYRKKAIRALEPVLDDKKRLVRKEAVLARNDWCVLGEPGR